MTPPVPRFTALRALAAALLCEAAAELAQAQASDADTASAPSVARELDPVEVRGRHYDNAVGTSDAASEGAVRAELLKSRPALRPGEVLEFVPGVIVTQHSGDGKANQYFLRGFNLDHGTDFATTVNGTPVNMPSHGHGQGYSDLNFLVPELIERIEYRKGPYFARSGNFSAAGSADIVYRRTLDTPFAAITLGERGYRRIVGGGSVEVSPGTHLLGVAEVHRNDGPWEVPEDLQRTNAVVTLSGGTRAQGWSASLMGYDAEWTATDQIPERLIEAGSFDGEPFGRFDSLDPSDGGNTRRISLSGEWHRATENSTTRASFYAIDYRLKLFSNFTYALERPALGDQFSQQDDRTVYGMMASHALAHDLVGRPARTEFGLQVRHDRIRVGLFDTVEREIVATTREDKVRETHVGVYAQTSLEIASWLHATGGLRADHGRFKVRSLSNAENSGTASDRLFSPKLSLVFGPWSRTEFFVNAGRGFHSNDARGTTANVDPRTGDPVDDVPGLVKAEGYEIGARTELIPGLQSSLALWKLDFDSELVYVGDAGATEANRPSTRRGVEWNNRYIPRPWLLIDADLAWTRARFTGDDPDDVGDRIPNSVDKIASFAVTVRDIAGWSASMQWRYLGSGALIEDNSVRSRSSTLTNLRVNYRFHRKAEVTLDVFNLFDRDVNDIEYFYESRLPTEPPGAAIADRHVHPAEPRTARLTVRVEI
jgi:outer membrane receptor protein involved in Fe transport